ncbi:MAG: ribose-5-phosphate isomerase RpiA [Phycisphaerales bacterium]
MLSEAKKAAAVEAFKYVKDHTIVGLGSGTTAEFFISELGERIAEQGLDIKAVATSYEAQMLAYRNNIPILNLANVDRLALAVDGADEVDQFGNAIKGKGGAQTLEKIIASISEQFIIIADQTKIVDTLGENSPVPLEVIPQALRLVIRKLEEMKCKQNIRISSGKVGPVITDLGNFIIDAKFDSIKDPEKLNRELNDIPGVVGHGLFVGMADMLIAGVLEDDKITVISKNFRNL